MTKDEALQLCLEYIETDAHERRHVRWAIKEALKQEQGEPVGFYDAENKDLRREIPIGEDGDWWQPVYTTPQQRTWVDLTDEEIEDCYKQGGIGRAMQMLKEKNK